MDRLGPEDKIDRLDEKDVLRNAAMDVHETVWTIAPRL